MANLKMQANLLLLLGMLPYWTWKVHTDSRLTVLRAEVPLLNRTPALWPRNVKGKEAKRNHPEASPVASQQQTRGKTSRVPFPFAFHLTPT